LYPHAPWQALRTYFNPQVTSAFQFTFHNRFQSEGMRPPDVIFIGKSFNVFVGQMLHHGNIFQGQIFSPHFGVKRRTAMVGSAVFRIDFDRPAEIFQSTVICASFLLNQTPQMKSPGVFRIDLDGMVEILQRFSQLVQLEVR
jgi:hypothetical protein